MPRVEPVPFPFEAVRDLLGILRAFYASQRARGGSAVRLAGIEKLARELRAAVALARGHELGTEEHARAWAIADRATLRLADLVDVTTPLEPTLLVAGERVRAGRSRGSSREAARRARLIRS